MIEKDFSIGGRQFKLSKMDTIKQFHIVRRVGPILSDLMPAFKDAKALQDAESLSLDEKLDAIAKVATPFMEGLAKLSDQDSEFVLFGLLNAVEVQQPVGWARVANGTMLMAQDLELPTLLQLAGRAFMFNLSGFISALPAK